VNSDIFALPWKGVFRWSNFSHIIELQFQSNSSFEDEAISLVLNQAIERPIKIAIPAKPAANGPRI